jgi:predicted transcriptional regulator of viral defense system
MPATKDEELLALAEPQHGYFTSAQAKNAGLIQNTLTHMARRGVIERVSRGVYRLVKYPVSQLGQYMEATLWPQAGTQGVISHQSALAFHGMSDVSPAKVHITVPPEYRVRREIPNYLEIHAARLDKRDIQVLNGIPVTTPVRSILDCQAAHVRSALIRQAMEDGRAAGKLTAKDIAYLESAISRPSSLSSSSSEAAAAPTPAAPTPAEETATATLPSSSSSDMPE